MGQTLGRLITDLGERSTYDAASQCSRCGYCEQACPTYVATGQESKSGRGRNQIVRMLLEGKLSDPAEAEEALSTCLLCGACTAACYAHVPTADIVLEGRRMIRERPPWLARVLVGLLVRAPRRLRSLLKAGYALKRAGLSRLARPFLRMLGLGGLAEADEHVQEVPTEFLDEQLERMPEPEAPAWLYFAPCGPNYLYPRVGLATWKAMSRFGGGRPLKNGCCGLLPYNYGDPEDARTLARRVIETAEAQPEGIPIVGDCSSCVSFLKSYPQLFLEQPEWKERAQRFALRVKDAVEALSCVAQGFPEARIEAATYHDSCRACHGQGIRAEPRALMSRICGESYRELPESDVCCGGAGAFSFLHPELSDAVLRRKIGAIASTQARVVATSSTSCLLQLAAGLKKYYPECTVMHVSELVASALGGGHGAKTGA